jgi:hypothetical protein
MHEVSLTFIFIHTKTNLILPRLQIRCSYSEPQNLPTPPERLDYYAQAQPNQRGGNNDYGSPDLGPIANAIQNFDNIDYLGKKIASVLASYGDDIGIFCSTYFKTLHGWSPIVNKQDLYDGLTSLSTNPRADFAILILAIHLAIKTKEQGVGEQEAVEQMYRTTKVSYSLASATGHPSIDLIRAGLVIALHEYSQALHDAAYLTLGQCARMASLMGFDKTLYEDQPCTAPTQYIAEEQRRAWWCIFVLERLDEISFWSSK